MKPKSLSQLTKEADTVMSEYVRRRDSIDGIVQCFICGRPKPWKQSQAMHFRDRDQMSVRYDEDNVHAGCVECNCYDSGHRVHYHDAMVERYGEERLDELIEKSRSLAKFTRIELTLIIDVYKSKIKELKKWRR
jgi:hypothetical protein